MRLVYVFLGGSLKGSSVQHKIICQIEALRQHGIDARGCFFSNSVERETKLDAHVTLYPLKPYTGKHKYFHGFFETQYYYRQIHEFLRSRRDSWDYIFLRHGTSGPSYFALLKEFANRIFLYIPSNSIAENFRERQAAPGNGMVGYAFRWYEYTRYFYLNEKKLIKSVLPRLRAVVVFTEEFGRMLNCMAGGKIRIIYNRDGADCKRIPLRKPQYSGKTIRLLFMKGSSMLQPWAGLDRIIQSIAAHPEIPAELYITGNVIEKERYHFPFVKLTGRLSDADLEQLVNETDLGVSNLANYLIGFDETTNLKSRDYFARGLPFIQANTMPDVEGTEAAAYYLNMPNNSSLIDMQNVYDFAMQMRADTGHPLKMREFAEQHLDWSITVKELADAIRINSGEK